MWINCCPPSWAPRSAILALFFVLFPCLSAWSATLVLRHSFPSGSPRMEVITKFALLVALKTNQRISVDLAQNVENESDLFVLNLVKKGLVDMAIVRDALTSDVNAFGIFGLPYLIQSNEQMNKLADIISKQYMGSDSSKGAVVILGILGGDFHNIISRTPIRTTRDLLGLQMSLSGASGGNLRISSPMEEFFYGLETKPVRMPSDEASGAARESYVDAVEGTLSGILDGRTYEPLRYLTMTQHAYSPYYLIMNPKSFYALDPNTQEALVAAAREAQAFAFQTADADDHKNLETLRSRGVEVIEWSPSPAEKRNLGEQSRQLYDRFSAEVKGGYELLSQAVRLSPRSDLPKLK
jgi:TRAP-type C4-dicarboxylate transport system substrate-binding protein